VGFHLQPILGIGVGTPGLVNTSEGMVLNAVNLDWKNLPLAQLLEERYHLPVYVLNDSQAAAIGEHTYGKDHQQDEQLVVINVHHGIGSGIIINGDLFYGDGGSAGEIGHIVVVPENGLPCRCGKRGCLETVSSTQALIRRARMLLSQYPDTRLPHQPEAVTLDAIESAFRQGDPLAAQLVLDAGRYLGVAISNLVGILNIRKIVLVGDMTRFGGTLIDCIHEVMLQMSIPETVQNTQIELGHLGGNGIMLGASAMLANNYSLLFSRQPLPEL
jgi:N-acetylglucosamine repressor